LASLAPPCSSSMAPYYCPPTLDPLPVLLL
jgi:hypothetical protein